MKDIITLEKMNVATIYQVFLDAFANYFVSFEKKAELHIDRWLSAGVDFALSYGVKIDGQLVAFILHSPRNEMVMNLATGVRRDFQGQGLTGLMYERICRELPQKGFRKTQLEVIEENSQALRAYEKVGFTKTRRLLSWKGTFKTLSSIPGQYEIKKPRLTEEHDTLSPYPHAFEQSKEIILRRAPSLELHELRHGPQLIAYAVWNPGQMNIVQLGGLSEEAITGLLSQMKLSGEQVGMINIDERNMILNEALKKNGLVNFLSQYEMEKLL